MDWYLYHCLMIGLRHGWVLYQIHYVAYTLAIVKFVVFKTFYRQLQFW